MIAKEKIRFHKIKLLSFEFIDENGENVCMGEGEYLPEGTLGGLRVGGGLSLAHIHWEADELPGKGLEIEIEGKKVKVNRVHALEKLDNEGEVALGLVLTVQGDQKSKVYKGIDS